MGENYHGYCPPPNGIVYIEEDHYPSISQPKYVNECPPRPSYCDDYNYKLRKTDCQPIETDLCNMNDYFIKETFFDNKTSNVCKEMKQIMTNPPNKANYALKYQSDFEKSLRMSYYDDIHTHKALRRTLSSKNCLCTCMDPIKQKSMMKNELPPYCALHDNQLNDYFTKRFGNANECRPCFSHSKSTFNLAHRPKTAPRKIKKTSQYHSDYVITGSDNAFTLYQVTVTTGPKKHHGTAAKAYVQLAGSEGKLNKLRLKKSAAERVHTTRDEHHRRSSISSDDVSCGDVDLYGASCEKSIKQKHHEKCFPKVNSKKKYHRQHYGDIHDENNPLLCFTPGSRLAFKIYGPDLGYLKSCLIEHDGMSIGDSWFVESIEVKDCRRGKSYFFPCYQWLSAMKGDGHVARLLTPHKTSCTDYEIVVVTGDDKFAATSSRIFISLFGKYGRTEALWLHDKRHVAFTRGSSDRFFVRATQVGPLMKIRLESDFSGPNPEWLCDRVVVIDRHRPSWRSFVGINQWFSKIRDEGVICREFTVVDTPHGTRKDCRYKITVVTGKKKHSGTTANIFVQLFGELGHSAQHRLYTPYMQNFSTNSEDVFLVKCSNVGRLQKIRIGHDNSGQCPAWYLERVIVEEMDQMDCLYDFVCRRWLKKDNCICRLWIDLYPGALERHDSHFYTVKVFTGDKMMAGTDANVFVRFHFSGNPEDPHQRSIKEVSSEEIYLGKKHMSMSRKDSEVLDIVHPGAVAASEKALFEKNCVDEFGVTLAKLYSPLCALTVGHDNTGSGPGWFLDKVVIVSNTTGIEQEFGCNNWLAVDEGDRQIVRRLSETGRRAAVKHTRWRLVFHTSASIVRSGTDSKISCQLYGHEGKSAEILLADQKKEQFEQGSVDQFMIETDNIGTPFKLRVWHDNGGLAPGWHLDKVELQRMTDSGGNWVFPCNRWLCRTEDDGEIVRELPAVGDGVEQQLSLVKYVVRVHTGSAFGSGTNANVFVNLIGQLGDTGDRVVWRTQHTDKFERGQMDELIIEAVDLVKVEKVRIGHDGRQPGDGWYVDKVTVSQMTMSTDGAAHAQSEQVFPCNKWLDVKEDDGEIVRTLTTTGVRSLDKTLYHITVITGKKFGAGCDSNVYLYISGTTTQSEKLMLKSSETHMNKFEAGATDVFRRNIDDLGDIREIQIGTDGGGIGADWLLDELIIHVPFKGKRYYFTANAWLNKQNEFQLKMPPSKVEKTDRYLPYEVSVHTTDMLNAGTNAKVFIQLYGQDGRKTDEVPLGNKSDNFERAAIDQFKIEAADVGPISKIRVGHDGKGRGAGWHLAKIIVSKPKTRARRRKHPKRHSIRSDKLDTHHRVSHGGLDRDDDTMSMMSGATGTTFRSPRTGSSHDRSASRQSFQSDSSGQSGYHGRGTHTIDGSQASEDFDEGLEDEELLDPATWEIENYYFVVDKWFATDEGDGQIQRTLLPTTEDGKPLERLCQYDVRVTTGDKSGAGTDANVNVNIFGERFDTGPTPLTSPWDPNLNQPVRGKKTKLFERKQTDLFRIESTDLGPIIKLRVWCDTKGFGSDWYLSHIEVVDLHNNAEYFFPCASWLGKGKDKELSKDLLAVDKRKKKSFLKQQEEQKKDKKVELAPDLEAEDQKTTYRVTVQTGDVMFAGTDANCYIKLYGDEQTDDLWMKNSLVPGDKFERNRKDIFEYKLLDIGNIKKLKIWHDNRPPVGDAWHVAHVEIDAPKLGKKWFFPCNKWFDAGKGDKLICRELFPDVGQEKHYDKKVSYEICTQTSDILGAGTDADIYVVLYAGDDVPLPVHKDTNQRHLRTRPGTAVEKSAGRRLSMASGHHHQAAATPAPASHLRAIDVNPHIKPQTEKHSLCKSKDERKAKFERNQKNTFVVELDDIGDFLKHLKIGFDKAGLFGDGWHVKTVTVTKFLTAVPDNYIATGKHHDDHMVEDIKVKRTWFFKCNEWFDNKHGTVKTLTPEAFKDEWTDLDKGDIITKRYKILNIERMELEADAQSKEKYDSTEEEDF